MGTTCLLHRAFWGGGMLGGRQESARRTGAVRGWNMDDCMSTAAYMLGDDTHDERNAGWVIGCQGAKSEGAVQGQGVFCPTVTCRRWGEMEGMMMICGRACREPPTTLTASWWAGYSGREGGGEGRGGRVFGKGEGSPASAPTGR